jgi:hypothetical protein
MATEMIRPYTGEDKPPLIDLLRLNTPRYLAQSEESDFAACLDHETEDYFVVEEGRKLVAHVGSTTFLIPAWPGFRVTSSTLIFRGRASAKSLPTTGSGRSETTRQYG